MIRFILNDMEISTDHYTGSTLLDFIRYHKHLTGTKIGCREGDCGACTVLEGQLEDNRIHYRSIVSCLTPLGNAHGKHIVTIEGLNTEHLIPAQKAMVDHSGTQCGICTPGFVVSLTGYTMEASPPDPGKAIDSMSGNICRCTGYKSIQRAANTVANMLEEKNPDNPIGWLVSKGYLPAYFVSIPEQLAALRAKQENIADRTMMIGGGTDLMVQQPDVLAETNPALLFDRKELKGIYEEDGHCVVGSAATATDIMESVEMRTYFPRLDDHFFLVSSEPIRNMGTIGGNIVNASPIADLVAMFMALDTELELFHTETQERRRVPLNTFYKGYKKMDLEPGEIIHHLRFPVPGEHTRFNFEKVSRRNTLDIASVNTAIFLEMHEQIIRRAKVSMGGVAPIPLFLEQTGVFLTGKELNTETILRAAGVLQGEIAPISDIRGSKEYKRLLARQLFFAHFIELFPHAIRQEDLNIKQSAG